MPKLTRKTLFLPGANTPRPTVHPVFIPFQGCAARCVFCAQPLQTGENNRSVAAALKDAEIRLTAAAISGEPRELAFYGGTFTALPLRDQFACLELASRYREKGVVTKVRASTRPDACDRPHLERLRLAGLDMLELGVQSFYDTALDAARRAYAGTAAQSACNTVKESGLELGIQLMPGMPGMDAESFRRDMQTVISLAPATLRLYPCLVLAGTTLAEMFQRGEFTPWTLDRTVPLLAEAQLAAWRAGIAVIRIGLAPQDTLDQGGVLAGPRHPALGSMVRGRALYLYLREELKALNPAGISGLALPRRFQGEFWGHRGELKPAYAALGVTPGNVLWQCGDQGEVRFSPH